jgi:ESX secretion system ATPase EccB
MQSRRDQLQAHTYVLGRLTSALVHAEPDAAETPLRRTTVGWFAGVMVAAILVAGFAVYGLIFHGGGSRQWGQAGSLIVEKETGNRFVYAGGALHPVLNYASARLLLKGAGTVRSVSAASMGGVPHGLPVGIAGAPDALPAPDRLSAGGWLVCPTGLADQSGTVRPAVVLALGGAGTPRPLDPGAVVLAETTGGEQDLLWDGRRFPLAAPWVADALGAGSAPSIAVTPSYVDTLPAGPDLGPVDVPGRGTPGPVVGGSRLRIGQVVRVHGIAGPDGYYLVRADGLGRLSATWAALLLADPGTAAAYPGGHVTPVTVDPDALAAAPRSGTGAPTGTDTDGAVPAVLPHPARLPSGAVPCARTGSARDTAVRLVAAAAPAGDPPATGTGPLVADRIAVPADTGAVVVPLLPSGRAGGTRYLVTDLGVKYPLPTADAATYLGYGRVRPVPVPAAVLALLPTGPALDPARIRG